MNDPVETAESWMRAVEMFPMYDHSREVLKPVIDELLSKRKRVLELEAKLREAQYWIEMRGPLRSIWDGNGRNYQAGSMLTSTDERNDNGRRDPGAEDSGDRPRKPRYKRASRGTRRGEA